MRGTDTFGEQLPGYRGLLFPVCHRPQRDGGTYTGGVRPYGERRGVHGGYARTGNSGRTRGYARTWLWRVARSTCIDLQRRSPLPKDYDGADEETALHDTLHDLIAHLPETDRIIVTMHLEGYNYPETGHAAGMTKNNIGVRLMRIKGRLKQEWNTI